MILHKELGFSHMIVVIIICVIVVGALVWRFTTLGGQQDSSQSSTQQQNAAELTDALSLAEQEELKAKNGDIPPTAESTPGSATTQANPTKPVDNATKGAAPQAAPTTTAPSQPTTTPPPPAPTVLRPTPEFCAQKNGSSFTNVWFTGNASYTYEGYAWENGYSYTLPRTSKTESGTPVRQYDTMQIFDVLAYGTQPKWAICSDKAGYVMVYYSVPNSPYTFNALAEYGHLSLQQP